MSMYILNTEVVVESLRVLRGLGLHRNTIMYLCAKRASVPQKTNENLKVDFREFFDRYLTVRGAPPDKPYIIPFESSDVKLWLNNNLAGSFAPSSIRPENPINTVLQVNGNGVKTTYTLKPKHWIQVANNLLNGTKIPAIYLAAFLYRDFAFQSDTVMSGERLMNQFQREFGYDVNNEEFDVLYEHDSALMNQTHFTEYFEL